MLENCTLFIAKRGTHKDNNNLYIKRNVYVNYTKAGTVGAREIEDGEKAVFPLVKKGICDSSLWLQKQKLVTTATREGKRLVEMIPVDGFYNEEGVEHYIGVVEMFPELEKVICVEYIKSSDSKASLLASEFSTNKFNEIMKEQNRREREEQQEPTVDGNNLIGNAQEEQLMMFNLGQMQLEPRVRYVIKL